MVNLLLLLICLIIGIALRRVKTIPKDAHLTINNLILYVPLPALSLLSIPELRWNADLLLVSLVSWIIFGVSFVTFTFLGKKFFWPKEVVGCLILTAGLGNTGFVGFPVVEALYGREALKIALVLDQLGSFLVVSSVGIWVAGLFSYDKMRKTQILKRVLYFPPFVAFAVAILLGQFGWTAQGDFKEILSRLANLLTPLALISVGLQLEWKEARAERSYLLFGLGFKLLLAPILIYFIYWSFQVPIEVFRVVVIEAAMAPMITGAIVAASHNLRPRLAGMLIGFGVPMSFLTLTIWYFLL